MIGNDAFRDMTLGAEERRMMLPCFKDPKDKVRLFSVIKDMAGKDLTKITFPGKCIPQHSDLQRTTFHALELLRKPRVRTSP